MQPETQLALFDPSALPAGRELLLPVEEQRHRFTAEQVALNVERYAAIVSAIAEGLGVRQICRAFGVSHHTVLAIREKDPALIATEKERHRGEFRNLVRLAADRLREALEKDELSPSALPVALGILQDKSLALEGMPSMVVSVRHELDQDAVTSAFRRLQQQATAVIDVSFDTASQETGLKPTEKGHFIGDAVADAVELKTWTQSLDPAPEPAAATSTASLPSAAQAGAGVAFEPAPPAQPMDCSSENLNVNEEVT